METFLHHNGSATEVLPNYHPFNEYYSVEKDILRRFAVYLISFRPHLARTQPDSYVWATHFETWAILPANFFFTNVGCHLQSHRSPETQPHCMPGVAVFGGEMEETWHR